MKKILILSSAMVLMTAYSANAQISVSIGEPAPVYYAPEPGYVVAPDWPSEHYDIHRHRHNDYWAHRQQEERGHDHGHR
jgi:hypothetical protein